MTEKKNVKVVKKKIHEAAGFNPLKWDGVELKMEKTYWVIRSRTEVPGLTPMAVAEQPHEVVEAEWIGFDNLKGEDPISDEFHLKDRPVGYAFDDGRMKRRGTYLAIPFDDREQYVYPHTSAGRKSADALIADWRARNVELIAAARGRDETVCLETALEASLSELETMIIALGGVPRDLQRVGKSRKKKAELIVSKRAAWFETKGKKPIPDRSSTRLAK